MVDFVIFTLYEIPDVRHAELALATSSKQAGRQHCIYIIRPQRMAHCILPKGKKRIYFENFN